MLAGTPMFPSPLSKCEMVVREIFSYRLTRLVLPFAAIVLLQASIAGLSLKILSSVRAYIAGESIWSRAQKDAVYSLTQYLHSGQDVFFRQYRTALAVPLGDQFARLALELEKPDDETARAGFLQGGNHPDDVPELIWLFRNFRHVSYLEAAIQQWIATDSMLLQLGIFGDAIRTEMRAGLQGDELKLRSLSSELYDLNRNLTVHANAFSEVLGEGSRSIRMILAGLNSATAAALIFLMIWHTRRLVQQRESFEAALNEEKKRLAWQAAHDPLTQLANRREFEAQLREHLGRLRVGQVPHLVMVIDLDQFKIVNDTCGHLAGDRLLREISEVMKRETRPGDVVARLGGDEFGLVLPHCEPHHANTICERLRRAVENYRFGWEGRSFAVTASIGKAFISDECVPVEEALRQADRACYGAKEQGRNRIQIYCADDAEFLQRVGDAV